MACVWGPPSVRQASSCAGGAPGWPVSGLLADGCVWTRQVVFTHNFVGHSAAKTAFALPHWI